VLLGIILRSLLYAAHNELLSRMEIIIEAGLRARDLLVHHQPHWPDSVPVHDAIVAALKAGTARRRRRPCLPSLTRPRPMSAGPGRKSRFPDARLAPASSQRRPQSAQER
jgi:hypothetical protein